jgi:hypothetical protein
MVFRFLSGRSLILLWLIPLSPDFIATELQQIVATQLQLSADDPLLKWNFYEIPAVWLGMN